MSRMQRERLLGSPFRPPEAASRVHKQTTLGGKERSEPCSQFSPLCYSCLLGEAGQSEEWKEQTDTARKRRLTPRCLDSRPALTLIGCRALTNGIESVCAHLGNGDGDDSLHLQNGCEGSRSELMV